MTTENLQEETAHIKSAFDDLRICAEHDPMMKLALEKAEGAVLRLLIAAADRLVKADQEIEEQKHVIEHLAAMTLPGDN